MVSGKLTTSYTTLYTTSYTTSYTMCIYDIEYDVVYDLTQFHKPAACAKRRRFKVSAPLRLDSRVCSLRISSASLIEISGRIQHSATPRLSESGLPTGPSGSLSVPAFIILLTFFIILFQVQRFESCSVNIHGIHDIEPCLVSFLVSCTRIRAFHFQIRFRNYGLTCGCKLLIENPSFLNYVICHFDDCASIIAP
jgi:hypothetical protein